MRLVPAIKGDTQTTIQYNKASQI